MVYAYQLAWKDRRSDAMKRVSLHPPTLALAWASRKVVIPGARRSEHKLIPISSAHNLTPSGCFPPVAIRYPFMVRPKGLWWVAGAHGCFSEPGIAGFMSEF